MDQRGGMAVSDLHLQLRSWRLTTAEILYHMPDHPGVLQSFIWQRLDRAPDFPELKRFLDFWERNIDGRLHSVKVANAQLVTPGELAFADAELRLH
jgi:uncharacterized protein Usg